jgi:hypothetical protein
VKVQVVIAPGRERLANIISGISAKCAEIAAADSGRVEAFGRLSMGKRWAQIYDGADGSMEELA